jgi:hypothetical protein
MPKPRPAQQAAIETSIGSVQRIAMLIIDKPRNLREAAIEIARRNYADVLKENGLSDDEQARAWLDLQITVLRALISKIEASGSTRGTA